MLRGSLAGLLLLAAGARAQTAPSPPASPSERLLLQRIDQHYNHLNSLRARYSEHYTGLGLDRTETGTLLLRKPGRMLWRYDRPAGKVFVLDGKYAWSYTPGDAQAQRVPAKQLDDLRSPLRLLLGHTQIGRELDSIRVTPATGQGFVVTGVPRLRQSRIRSLSLVVTAGGVIQSMRIEDEDGTATDFSFSSIEENVPAPDDAFHFTPPAGVSVVDGLPPV